MKELRPPSSGTTEIRLLFAFGPRREAIFLVAGDKAGNWDGWYREAEISGIDIVRAYVAALGGSIDVVARLGDRSWKVA